LKRNFFAFIIIVILISGVVGYACCDLLKYEVSGEWFQTGNTLLISEFQPKQSKELEDNRIGGMWPLHGYQEWMGNNRPIDEIYADYLDGLASGISNLGLKWIRTGFDFFDWTEVEETGSYSQLSIDPVENDTITALSDSGINLIYTLVFWDEEIQAGEGYSRFKTEDEIQRYLDYVRFIVRNCKNRVEYYEILNEPNINTQGTQQYVKVSDYIDMSKRAISVIREEYPEAKIIVGAVTPLYEPSAREYFFEILRSDLMTLVDAVSWHAMSGISPQFREEFYYNYTSLLEEIREVASSHGFTGEYRADEMHWRTPDNPHPHEYWGYTTATAAKYFARGIIIHLGMNFSAGLSGVCHDLHFPKEEVIQNLCTIMAGAEARSLPIMIRSKATNIQNYTFSLPNGDKLIALWTDSLAIDEDPGVEVNLTLPDSTGQGVKGIDILEGFQQTIVTSYQNDNLIIQNLIVRDYPLILQVYTKLSSSITCSLSKSEITEGESITISGAIDPALSNRNVTLTYEKPDGSTQNRTVTTDSEGDYSDSFTPDTTGSWKINASWKGDEEYKGASSSTKSFTVKEQEQPSGCLIATATYGSELSPEVQFLRDFRDNTVSNTFAGSQFMNVFNAWYYSFSPKVASAIEVNDALRGLMKNFLYPLIGILYLTIITYSLFSFNPEFAVLVSGLIASSLIGIVYFAIWILIPSLYKKFKIPVKVIQIQSLILVIIIGCITLAEITKWSNLMMFSTAIFILTSMSISLTTFMKYLLERLN
jgi:hypothetical protein